MEQSTQIRGDYTVFTTTYVPGRCNTLKSGPWPDATPTILLAGGARMTAQSAS